MRSSLAGWLLVPWLAVGCGDDAAVRDGAPLDGAAAADGGIDAGTTAVDARPGYGDGGCASWTLVPATVTAIASLDPAPVNPERTTRVVVTIALASCEERAMPEVVYRPETREAFVAARVWRRSTGCGGGSVLQQPVPLVLASEGTWTVRPGPLGSAADGVAVVVGSAPDRPCNPAIGACAMDCDCDDGERCLGGWGLGGPFTECAAPCEVDHDCAGGSCVSRDDGLDHACDPGIAECATGRPCPGGYDCTGGVCQPDFLLGQATRVACTCDAECAAPLRCVGAGPGRCELACPTAGPWCSLQHYCGPADEDIAGLAEVDSVCVWAGD